MVLALHGFNDYRRAFEKVGAYLVQRGWRCMPMTSVASARRRGRRLVRGAGAGGGCPSGDGVPWVVSTLPDLASNRALLHALTARGYGGEVAIVARDEAQGTALKRLGAPTVLYPFRDAVDFTAEHLAALIRPGKETS